MLKEDPMCRFTKYLLFSFVVGIEDQQAKNTPFRPASKNTHLDQQAKNTFKINKIETPPLDQQAKNTPFRPAS